MTAEPGSSRPGLRARRSRPPDCHRPRSGRVRWLEQERLGAQLRDPLADIAGHGRRRLVGFCRELGDHVIHCPLAVAELPDPGAELVEQLEAVVVGADEDDAAVGFVRLDPRSMPGAVGRTGGLTVGRGGVDRESLMRGSRRSRMRGGERERKMLKAGGFPTDV